MARTLVPLMLLTVAVGCRNGGGDRDVGAAPRGFDTPRTLRGAPAPDDPARDAATGPALRAGGRGPS